MTVTVGDLLAAALLYGALYAAFLRGRGGAQSPGLLACALACLALGVYLAGRQP